MRRLRTLALVTALLGTLLCGYEGFVYVRERSAGDACVDGGGSFDYDHLSCDYSANHPFVRYSLRHPHSLAFFVAGLSAIFTSAGVLVILKRRLR